MRLSLSICFRHKGKEGGIRVSTLLNRISVTPNTLHPLVPDVPNELGRTLPRTRKAPEVKAISRILHAKIAK